MDDSKRENELKELSHAIVEALAQNEEVMEMLTDLKERNVIDSTTDALARFLGSVELHCNAKIATTFFTHQFVNSDEWQKVDSEGFVNHPLAIIGVEVAALLREIEPGVTRVSLRAKHDVDVNVIANGFGGGGHAKAAGCTIEASLDDARTELIAAIAPHLPWVTGPRQTKKGPPM